jgi:hypothetical protein
MELRMESELLRGTILLQCDELVPKMEMVEKGYAMAQLAWANRGLISTVFAMFSPSAKQAAGEAAE